MEGRLEYSRPLPELLDGDDWEVRNSSEINVAYVDFKKKEFVVPFAPGPAGELIRAHEAMHVKITPHNFNKEGLEDFVTLQAVEDSRVHQGLHLSGIETNKGRVFAAEALQVLTKSGRNTPLRLGEAVFATKGLAEEKDVRELIQKTHKMGKKILEISDEIHTQYFAEKEAKGELSTYMDTKEAAKELRKRLTEISTEDERLQDRQNGRSGSGEKNLTQSWQPGSIDAEAELRNIELPVITAEEMKEIKDALPRYSARGKYRGVDPGPMNVEKSRFDAFLKFKKIKNIKKTASDEGIVPSRMHRYATDMRVFTRPGRRRSSTAVLVDVSGSMGLTAKDIVEILRLSPEGVVAIYSGRGHTGTLRVIAEKSRFSTLVNSGMGGNNVVDYPALQWLAKRPEKHKLWVSDGMVTGKGDQELDEIYIRKIVKLVIAHKIVRVGSVKRLMKEGAMIDGRFDSKKEIVARSHVRIVDSAGKTIPS